MMAPVWLAEHSVEGHLAFRIGRDGDHLVAEWPGLCELRSTRDGAEVSFSVEDDANPRLIAKIKAGLGAALVRHLAGETSLHACAFSRGREALVCLGPSGAGKSTLAAWMCSQRDHALLADDIVRVASLGEGTVAEPTEREHWLDIASSNLLGVEASFAWGKAPTPARVVAAEPARVRAMLALSFGSSSQVELVRLRGQRAIAAILPCLVRFVIDEPAVHIDEVSRIESILERTPIYELSAPRRFDALPAVAEALEALR